MGYPSYLITSVGEKQEQLCSTKKGIISSVQCIYIPLGSDNIKDAAVKTLLMHFDSFVLLNPDLASSGIYPSIDILNSFSNAIDESIIGSYHFKIYQKLKSILIRVKELEHTIKILGEKNLNSYDQKMVKRGKLILAFVSQPFRVSERYTGRKGVFVQLKDTLDGFNRIADGKLDHINPEDIMYKGSISDIF